MSARAVTLSEVCASATSHLPCGHEISRSGFVQAHSISTGGGPPALAGRPIARNGVLAIIARRIFIGAVFMNMIFPA